MRILGIDPGLATVGIGMVEAENTNQIHAKDWCIISTKPDSCLADRLVEIHEDLQKILRNFQPDYAVIEQLFFATNKKTAFDVAQARGVILQTVSAQGIPIIEATPMQLKSAIAGNGGALKREMQDMLVRILHLEEIPTPDDAADALGLAVYGALQVHSAFHVS